MFLVAGPGPEFIKFIQILSWIVLPILLIAVIVTVYMHYKKKKRAEADLAAGKSDEDFIHASPEQVGYTKGDGEYVLFDHSSLIQEYKHRLSYHHAKYSALQRDFNKLENKFSLLVNYASFPFNSSKNKIIAMESSDNKPYATVETKAEQGYLKDMLDEKKAHIEFLQAQLDQRVKQQHLVEHQKELLAAQLADAKAYAHTANEEIAKLTTQVMQKQDEADKLNAVLCTKEEALEQNIEQLHLKQDQIIYLENLLKEEKERTALLHAESGDYRDKVALLEQDLMDSRSRNEYLQQRIEGTRQQMRRIMKEFSGFIENDDESPVIPLRPDYIHAPGENMVQPG